MTQQIKPGSKVLRTLTFDRSLIDTDARTVELAFSSEEPYDRWWGREILDHSPTSVRLGRLSSGGPLLMDHDTRDQVGVAESVRIEVDRVGRSRVRFGKSVRANEVFQDVIDGIRTKVSVGYIIHEAVLVEKGEDIDTWRVTDWEPYEISLVSVPADATVGVGRSADEVSPIEIIEAATPNEKAAETPPSEIPAIEETRIMTVTVEEATKTARQDEQRRAAEIIAIGTQFAQFGAEALARDAIGAGLSVDAFRAQVLEKVGTQPKPNANIGLNEKEVRRYSMARVMHALANPNDRSAQEAAAFEREASAAAAQLMGRTPQGIMVPNDVLQGSQRDLVAGTNTAGGFTVQTDLLETSFIDLLRNRLSVMAAGAQLLTGLNGNVAIPKQTGAATAYWVAENTAPTESQQTLGQVTLTPKTVGAYTDYSRRLLLQSSMDVEGFIRNDLAAVLALAIDAAALNGSGAAGQPLGLMGTAGIGSVAGSTNGAAVTWANIVALETAVAIANADVNKMGYLTNAKQRGALKSTAKISGVTTGMIWDGGDAPVNGYGCTVSNQVPSNLVKGSSGAVCSAILFGNWADLIIGMWGGLDLMVDPYTGSNAGTVRIVALQDVDVAVRNAVSFAAMLDAL